MVDQNALAEESLDFGKLLAALRRRWPLLLAGPLLGAALAHWHTGRSPQVWQGEFQIVVRDRNSGASIPSAGGSLGALAGLAGFTGGGKAELETEVAILESPSVLQPIYEWVSSREAQQARQPFSVWANQLKVAVKKNTSVLEVAYTDTNQVSVLPVLQQVAEAYRRYSNRERVQSLQQAIAYTGQQLARYRSQAEASSRAADAYRLRYGISSSGQFSSAGGGIDLNRLLNPTASSSAFGGVSGSSGGGSSSFAPAGGDALSRLNAVNLELIRRRQLFTDQDPAVIELLREREGLRRYVAATSAGAVALSDRSELSKGEAQAILVQYRELERRANRDQSTLDSLESALRSLELEQARASQPWELISTPTLLDRPISPRPMRALAIGVALGLAAGSAAALAWDRRGGRLYDTLEISTALDTPLLAEWPSLAEALEQLPLLVAGPLQQAPAGSLALLLVGIEPEALEPLRLALAAASQRTVLCSDDVLVITGCSAVLVLTAPGAATQDRLTQLQRQLALQPAPLLGALLLQALPKP
jgi:succinoglycan biosynthesis transport protein ExoP